MYTYIYIYHVQITRIHRCLYVRAFGDASDAAATLLAQLPGYVCRAFFKWKKVGICNDLPTSREPSVVCSRGRTTNSKDFSSFFRNSPRAKMIWGILVIYHGDAQKMIWGVLFKSHMAMFGGYTGHTVGGHGVYHGYTPYMAPQPLPWHSNTNTPRPWQLGIGIKYSSLAIDSSLASWKCDFNVSHSLSLLNLF